MAANQGWFHEWYANGWFPSVWFAPADETGVPEEELRHGGLLPWWYVAPRQQIYDDERPEDPVEELKTEPIDKAQLLAAMFPANRQRAKKSTDASTPAQEARSEQRTAQPPSGPTAEELALAAEQTRRTLALALLVFEMV